MSSAAQDEFNQLLHNSKVKYSSHPEDRDRASSPSDTEEDQEDPSANPLSDSDDENDTMRSRTATYHVPNTVFDANTGPKGVIADAQAFERARKQSHRRTLGGLVSDDTTPLNHSSPPRDGAKDEDEEGFMRKWRESRMNQLQGRNMRRSSPRRKRFGGVDTVDAAGYLDAIEQVTADTVVVVCVYDPESSASGIVEDCLNTIARRNVTTHFVKLHQEIAEMDHIQAPALLAYRGGDVFATIVEIFRQIPKGRACSADSLEELLKQYVPPTLCMIDLY
ncbi:phosducin family protein [Aspergillus glaucus CBS 516.65]|uniref:Phosducin domain-containing protein n=1 Tax=Aspergillus glaucus CBS 516.65 TaxID=1160497 RepID=A0A1L9VBV7_ASPGL|nr:hypothetical protein ASPGLDRAFT_84429 [Aspergillus glaucus CBS 516.65]OJJ81379.1 hypothetical protein ASPGLDRAFT_84429 [Aspergillus glaucus CBS 516.65]